MQLLDPQPRADELPPNLGDPFDPSGPHPIARRAAMELRARLANGPHHADLLRAGKMFGVLVVRSAAGPVGYLSAFAGRMGREWIAEGFVPPIFDDREDDPRWHGRERQRADLDTAIKALVAGKGDNEQLDSLEQRRKELSRAMLDLVQNVYPVPSWSGEQKTVSQIFAPRSPPGGVGECAAPKLLAEALRQGLTPLAVAELWVGAPPKAGNREDGVFYPACEKKCAPLIPYMLRGLERHDSA